jgi:hypothetical protein
MSHRLPRRFEVSDVPTQDRQGRQCIWPASLDNCGHFGGRSVCAGRCHALQPRAAKRRSVPGSHFQRSPEVPCGGRGDSKLDPPPARLLAGGVTGTNHPGPCSQTGTPGKYQKVRRPVPDGALLCRTVPRSAAWCRTAECQVDLALGTRAQSGTLLRCHAQSPS